MYGHRGFRQNEIIGNPLAAEKRSILKHYFTEKKPIEIVYPISDKILMAFPLDILHYVCRELDGKLTDEDKLYISQLSKSGKELYQQILTHKLVIVSV
jgi:hypothetical protein